MSYKYCLYSYIERILYESYKYSSELHEHDFDKGIVRALHNALQLIKIFLKKHNLLKTTKIEQKDKEFIKKHKSIMTFNIDIDDDLSDDVLLNITKEYVVKIQNLYNGLLEKRDSSLNKGIKFGYYILLDMLESELRSFEYRKLFKNFNISIPILLDKKVKISKL